MSEDGTTATAAYAVVLTSQPSGNVTISAADTPDRVDLAPTGPLVFTPASWDTAQTVTVTGKPDDLDATVETVTLTHTLTTVAAGDYAGETVAAVTVEVTDDDTPGLLVTPAALALAEEGVAKTYTLRLNTRPSGPVTVSVDNADDGSAVTVLAGADADTQNETETLTLGVANYAGVTEVDDVTVTVTDDDSPNLSVSAAGLTGDGLGEQTAEAYTLALTTQPAGGTVTLTHTPGGADYAGLAAVSLGFTVVDDDTRGVTLDADPATPLVADAGPLAVYEDAAHADHTAPYTVRLATQPAGGSVTVTLTNTHAGALTVAPARLIFTASTWNTAQTVRATTSTASANARR